MRRQDSGKQAPGRHEAACFKRKPDHSKDTVVHDKKDREKRLDDSCQCIKNPVGKDADSVQGCEGSTMSGRQQDQNWEKDVQDKVGLDRDVGGWEDKKHDVHDPGEVDKQGRKRKNEKRAGSWKHTWQGQQVR